MNHFFFLSFLLLASLNSSAQKGHDYRFDTLLKKKIFFSLPNCVDCDSTGISIIEVYKLNDSIKIKSWYSSGYGYNFEKDNRLTKRLNTELIDTIPVGYHAVIPLYFYYKNDAGIVSSPSNKAGSAAEKKIRKLKRKSVVLEPVIITKYPTQY